MGLIQNTMTGTNKQNVLGTDVFTADATTYDPTKRTVNAGTETVEGRLSSLLKTDSPYLTQARTGAAQSANSRGLLNTSMAAGAGEAAAINAALPIAQADANIYGQASVDNMNADNQSNQFNATSKNQTAQFNAGEQNKPGVIQATGKAQEDLQTLRGTQAMDLANLDAGQRALVQSSQAASTMFNTTQQQIAAIMADVNTSAEQKQAAVNSVSQMFKSGLSIIGGIANLNLVDLLDFTAA